MKTRKRIGIIGGMGPDASVRLYKIMIDSARSKYGAKENQDYPDILLHSVPVPDFISDQKRMSEALGMLKTSTRQLGSVCGILGMACNTAHILLDALRSQTATPFLSMVGLTASASANGGYKKIGLLATPTTFRSRLYQSALREKGIEIITPSADQIDQLGGIVDAILAGDFSRTRRQLTAIADGLVERGAEAIILGCTELPLVFPEKYQVPVISSLAVLADALLEEYYRSGRN
jgi:aspartate racemase